MVTRGNPKRAAAVIENAKALASGRHEINYIIGCDDDDPDTASYFYQNYSSKEITLSIANRPTGVGAVWNRCAALCKADIYCPFPDDVFIGMPKWDDYIVSLNRPLLAWNDLSNPGHCTLPIVTQEWLDLVGPLYDERFPFWFYDTCVAEIYSFVTGYHVFIPSDLTLISQKGRTQNLRELLFWWDLYVATRRERLALAARIRDKLGLKLSADHLSKTVEAWQRRDEIGRASAARIQGQLSAEGQKPPSAEYLAARANAQNYMDTLKAA
jgi:hypothetical protein